VNGIRFEVAGVLGTGITGALFTTLRVQREGAEHYLRFRRRGCPVIFVLWHGQLLPLAYHHRQEGIVVLVSEHADGEYVARVLTRCGFGTARGSSTRGGTRGLRHLVRAARAGCDLGITPDGPRGPARRFKPGALAVARVTGLPIIPMAAGASAAWRLRSWDGFLVPRPFARVRLAYGPPCFVPRSATRAELEALARDMEIRLNRLSAVAEAPDPPNVR